MRKVIVYTSILVVLALGVIYKGDYVWVEITEQVLKAQLNSAVYGACLLLDEESYAEGYVVFKDSDVQEYISQTVDDKYECTVHIFDNKGTYRKYENDTFISEEEITFPHFFTTVQGDEIEIESPCIIVDGVLEDEFYRLKELKNIKTEIMRSSMYMVEGRKV